MHKNLWSVLVLFTKRRAADAVGRPEGHVGGPLALMSSRSGTKLASLASESRELSTDAADALRHAPHAQAPRPADSFTMSTRTVSVVE